MAKPSGLHLTAHVIDLLADKGFILLLKTVCCWRKLKQPRVSLLTCAQTVNINNSPPRQSDPHPPPHYNIFIF